MEEPEKIVEVLEAFFNQQQDLKGKKVVITAGPTYEKIDPVRFIGNYSSGKMGYALAEECATRGAEVVLVSGPVTLQAHHPNIRRMDVESAQEMYEATREAYQDADAGILCAAVADFTQYLILVIDQGTYFQHIYSTSKSGGTTFRPFGKD